MTIFLPPPRSFQGQNVRTSVSSYLERSIVYTSTTNRATQTLFISRRQNDVKPWSLQCPVRLIFLCVTLENVYDKKIIIYTFIKGEESLWTIFFFAHTLWRGFKTLKSPIIRTKFNFEYLKYIHREI